MDNNLFKQDESFRFDISISDRRYDHKPTSEDYQAMTFHVENLNADKLLDKTKSVRREFDLSFSQPELEKRSKSLVDRFKGLGGKENECYV